MDDAHHPNHRTSDINYRLVDAGQWAGSGRYVNPYRYPYGRGIIRSVVREFTRVWSFVFVEEIGDGHRANGDKRSRYTGRW